MLGTMPCHCIALTIFTAYMGYLPLSHMLIKLFFVTMLGSMPSDCIESNMSTTYSG